VDKACPNDVEDGVSLHLTRRRVRVFAFVLGAGAVTVSHLALAAPTRAPDLRPLAPALTAPPRQQPSIQDVNDQFVRDLSARIVGRESQPSRVVFTNIKLAWFKNVPAKQLLEIMDGGYAKALGVRCTHCHVADDFGSDEKRPKKAAREMASMHWDINRRLARMRNLKDVPQERFINCATCHRGKTDPHDVER
jgi:Photosynthetic reaction centre cytochrome C subunit